MPPRAKKTSDKGAKPAQTEAVKTDKKLSHLKPFKSGAEWHGNANGRPKGSRNKLGEAFIQDMYDKWMERGATVIDAAMTESPGPFIRSMVAILPQEVHVKDDLGKLSNEELSDILTALRSIAIAGSHQPDRDGIVVQARDRNPGRALN